MFHASYILHQSRPFDQNLVINKFSDLICDVLGQFKLEHLDRLIHCIGEDISDKKVRDDLIDGMIRTRCNQLERIFSDLTLNEQFFILAHLNLDLLTTKVEKPSPVFVDMVCSIVHEAIAFGKYS
jgi:hypothetical protein